MQLWLASTCTLETFRIPRKYSLIEASDLYSKSRLTIHTYIHNWPLQPFGQDYGLASQTTVVFVNFIREWRDLQFNVDSEQQIFVCLASFKTNFINSFKLLCVKVDI